MARLIEMPKLSDTMEEGAVANWLKKEGDQVAIGEPLVEIETDKATQEYESPEDGVLLKIVVHKGKTVPLRTPIAVVGEAGEKVDYDALLSRSAGSGKAAAAPKAAAPAVTVPPPPPPHAGAGRPQIGLAAPVPAPVVQATPPGGRLRSSPLARKVAREQGLDISRIPGSGPGGRVVMRDVTGFRSGDGGAAQATPAPGAGDVVLPVSMMRKTIAKRLLAAKNDAPHFYLTVSAEVGGLEAWRKALNKEADKNPALPKVSLNDILIFAVARALRRHPVVNSSWQGDTILQNSQVHVAMAVALPEGLVTPVLRGTDRLGVREIAAMTRELAEKARTGKLGNQDYAGGTFTISNLGMFGVEEFTAIINPPQAAILAVGAARMVPWATESGELTAAMRMTMTMSCDHRVVDGATGAQFLKTLVSYLEQPLNMMV